MKKVRVGLIGAGAIARQHLEVLRDIDWMEACGITSRTRMKAERLAKEFGIRACTDNVDSLIRDVKPDGLMVLVSADQIYKVASDAMQYRLPLFIEKPAGLSAEESKKLADLADKNAVATMVGLNRRYYSIFRKGIEIIRNHGPLMGVFIEGHERMWLKRGPGSAFSEEILSAWIFANSVHTIDLLRFFGGEPLKVSSVAHSYKEPNGDQFAAIMEFESGAIGQYLSHWYSPDGWGVVLYGDTVTVKFKPLENGFWIDKDFKSYKLEPDDVDVRYKPGFFRQLEAFGRLVRDGKKEWPMSDLADSYKTMLLAKEISGA